MIDKNVDAYDLNIFKKTLFLHYGYPISNISIKCMSLNEKRKNWELRIEYDEKKQEMKSWRKLNLLI